MSTRDRNPPETPEGAAWELFMEIRRADEEERNGTHLTSPIRARLLNLYTECLATVSGRARERQRLRSENA